MFGPINTKKVHENLILRSKNAFESAEDMTAHIRAAMISPPTKGLFNLNMIIGRACSESIWGKCSLAYKAIIKQDNLEKNGKKSACPY